MSLIPRFNFFSKFHLSLINICNILHLRQLDNPKGEIDMAIKEREYLLSINEFKEPKKVLNKQAIGLLLVRLIVMEPGTDPLHPTMGVGIRRYRYGLNNVDILRKEVEYQIETFLPCYQNATVAIIVTPDKICNIEITIDDVVYVYETDKTPTPIRLTDIQNN